jgi:hypothetical protein
VEDIDHADEWLTRRLSQAAAEVDVTRRKETEDTREVIQAPNGLALDKEEKERPSGSGRRSTSPAAGEEPALDVAARDPMCGT